MHSKRIIIAIDGYSSCGKSTLAKALAVILNYTYIDSGTLYRAIALYFLRNDINLADSNVVVCALANIHLSFFYNENIRKHEILLNDENVEHFIRDMIVAETVSKVAAIKEVRLFVTRQLKKLGKKKGIVMDGRDIGTTVFPDAELKIFMTADPAVRVKRRFEELYQVNPNITLEEVKHNLELRDYIDSNRDVSPLRQAEDAIVLDNSSLTREEQLEKVLGWVRERSSQLTEG